MLTESLERMELEESQENCREECVVQVSSERVLSLILCRLLDPIKRAWTSLITNTAIPTDSLFKGRLPPPRWESGAVAMSP